MPFNRTEPHNALPLLPPDVDLETKPILRLCITANKALAELKGAGDVIPNQAMLINAIPLQEAKLSSEIENIVTTQDELFQAALDESHPADPKTKEVLRYRTALRHGYELLREEGLSLSLLEKVCGVLQNEAVAFRTEELVHIGNPNTGVITYTPPLGQKIIREKLDNLAGFLLERNELDPLIRLAVAHYQFEAIHPFDDGNGRTGRILNILYLLHEGLLKIPVLYLSRFIIQRKRDYYRLLCEVTEKGAWEDWVLYTLTGIGETAVWTTNRILAIRDLFETTLERCRQELSRRVYSKELIELVFTQPYCKIQFLVDAGIAARQTASEYLQELEKLGILAGERRGREMIYKHPALLDVLMA